MVSLAVWFVGFRRRVILTVIGGEPSVPSGDFQNSVHLAPTIADRNRDARVANKPRHRLCVGMDVCRM